MDKIRIRGGRKLKGVVEIGGAKNAALPILVASLLTEKPCRFERIPNLRDIHSIFELLQHLGTDVRYDPQRGEAVLRSDRIHHQDAPYDLVRKMRASVLVLGPLLARFGQARVSLPGGCAIGARPINFHLEALKRLGAKIELEEGYVIASASRLQGGRVPFEFPSVGATENLLMTAALVEGETVLENCAREPEIVDLASVLRQMGVQIEGEGTETIRVQGRRDLGPVDHPVMGDRIEAGTFLTAALITEGDVRVNGVAPVHLESVLMKLEEAGAEIERGEQFIRLKSRGRVQGRDVTTAPFPGFPTDMQAQFMTVMTIAEGSSVITETIFENRFMHVPELTRLGADIRVSGNIAVVRGRERLKAAPLMATDLRASASLVLGGLVAEGETIVSRVYHLDRGYERMEEKLRALGADIERVAD